MPTTRFRICQFKLHVERGIIEWSRNTNFFLIRDDWVWERRRKHIQRHWYMWLLDSPAVSLCPHVSLGTYDGKIVAFAPPTYERIFSTNSAANNLFYFWKLKITYGPLRRYNSSHRLPWKPFCQKLSNISDSWTHDGNQGNYCTQFFFPRTHTAEHANRFIWKRLTDCSYCTVYCASAWT